MRVLFSPFNQNSEKFPGAFDFGDFVFIFVVESHFVFSVALMEFSKQQSATMATRKYPLDVVHIEVRWPG